MGTRVLPARELTAWAAGFVLVSALIVVTSFTSEDPDSALHAGIAARLSDEPISRWVAPEWWGFWPEAELTGLYVEHPAGVFLLPAALGRLGIPAEQAAYVVGVGAGLLTLVLIGAIVSRVSDLEDGRRAMVLLQLMPVAFIFRIRANHEYLMLVCLLLTILGLQRARDSWWWTAAVAIGLAGGLLIKGVFVSLILLAAFLWIVIGPSGTGADRRRAGFALAIGVGVAVGAGLVWDALYANATGHTFWMAYWTRQLGPLTESSPASDLAGIAERFLFYVSRLLWHPAPWSVALVLAFVGRTEIAGRTEVRSALLFTVAFALSAALMLSLSSRFAERYAFSPVFVVGAAGAIVACRRWPVVERIRVWAESSVPMLPVALWTTLALLRLALGPALPRV